MRQWFLVVLVACACPSKQAAAPAQGSGATAEPAVATSCEAVRGKVEQLYRAEAQSKEPKRVDEAVADNTAMVMTDCAKDPAKTAACIAKAETLTALEKQCLVPIDEEGTEGETR